MAQKPMAQKLTLDKEYTFQDKRYGPGEVEIEDAVAARQIRAVITSEQHEAEAPEPDNKILDNKILDNKVPATAPVKNVALAPQSPAAAGDNL